ncbi:MAG: response regulator [Ruminococcus flavefaciens]|nr:response regulator [Ruminococcus flavefaciens]
MNSEQLRSFFDNIRTPIEMLVDYSKRIAGTDDVNMRKLYAETIENNSRLIRQMLQMFQSQLDMNTGGGSPAPAVPASAPVPVSAPAPVSGPKPEPVSEPAPRPNPRHAGTEEKPLILVAEDNDNNYFLLHAMLEDDYELLHAHDGIEAVEMFKTHNPRLILMDISMPNMDGYEATKEIRKVSENVPIIAVTAYAFASDKERIMSIGFNGYISKPINPVKLENEITNHL